MSSRPQSLRAPRHHKRRHISRTANPARGQFLRGIESLEDRSMMAISIASFGSAYTQDFNTLATTGTSSVTPPDWVFLETGTNANTTYAAGDGSSNTGNTYSFGTGTDTDRAFGGLYSGSLAPLVGASFQNNTGGVIEGLAISYKGEQWRLGTAGRNDRLEFQYSFNATSLNDGTWVDFNTLDFVAPNSTTVGALNGNTVSVNVSDTISALSIANGATFWLRWNNFDASGSDDGLAVDDFSLTANGSGGGGNTAPTITSNGGGATASINVPENTTAVTTVTATDTETPSTLSYALSGPDANKFTITSVGVLTFNTAPDFEAPTDVGTDNIYNVTVTVTDGGSPGLTDTQDLTITVTNVAEGTAPPVNTVPGLVLGTEDTIVNFTGGNLISVTDPDSGTVTTAVSVASATTKGTFAATNGGGTASVTPSNGGATLTFVGSPTNVNLALATLSFTPAANINIAVEGSVAVTVATTDGTNTDTDNFNINLNDVNDVPVGVADALTVLGAEDAASISIPATAFLTNDSRGASNESGQTLTLTGVSGAVGGSVSFSGGTVTFVPAADFNGTASFNYTMQDNGQTGGMGDPKSGSGSFSFTISEVNDAPTAVADSLTSIAEDSGVRTIPFSALLGNDSKGPANESGQALTITGVTAVAGGTVSISGTDVLFTPTANFSGAASFNYTLSDNGTTNGVAAPLTATGTASFTITAVDDTPTISDILNQTIGLNSSTGALNFTIGDIDTAVGSLTVSATSSNTTLVPNNVANLVLGGSGAARTINVIPAAGQSGTATITVTVSDGNTTASDTFLLTVTANTAPTISDVVNQSIAEDGALAAVNFTVNDNETAAGSLTVTATSSDQTIVANGAITINNLGGGNRSVAITPVANANGPVTITLTVSDGSLTATDTFVLNITEVNDAPATVADTLGTLAAEDGVAFTIPGATLTGNDSRGPANESGQTLTVTSVTAITGGTVSVAGNVITFTPAANFNGSASFTYLVTDNGTTNGVAAPLASPTAATVTFTISEVNDAPTAGADTLTSVAEDSAVRTIPFATLLGNDTTGPDNESTQTLTITGVTAGAGGTVSISGTNVLFTPAANFFGPASFTYTLQDNGTTNGAVAPQTATGSVSFAIDPVNDAPSFLKGTDVNVAYNAPAQSIPGWATSISAGPGETGQTVSFIVTNITNGSLFAVAPTVSATGTLIFTPAANVSGTATFSVVAQDSGGTAGGGVDMSGAQTFSITIAPAPINSLPTISPIGALSINENAGPQNVSLSGITAGGEPQALMVTASSSNPALIPTPSISYTSPSSTGTLTFASNLNQVGNSTITVTVRDAGFDGNFNTPDDGVTTTTFNVTVNAVNDPPVANDQTISTTLDNPVSGTLTASDSDGPTLTYGIAMNPTLGTLTAFNPATGAFTYTPSPGATGLDLFTFSVSDGTNSDTGLVRITILGSTAVVTPSGGDLVITGTPAADTILVTRMSNSTVQVRANSGAGYYPLTGALIINSGGGDDYVIASGVNGPTQMDLGEGNDYASGGLQDDVIAGGPGDDRINASGGNNILWGDNIGEQDGEAGGNDVLSTLGGNDILYGGAGNDQLFSGAGNDYINAGQGNDIVSGEAGDDRIFGGLGDDALYGDSGNDVISGGGGSDVASGSDGEDILIGGLGADTLNGGSGSDALVGGNTTNSQSSTAGDANDLALVALLTTWTTSHPGGLLSSVSGGNDAAPDSLSGETGDDDFYVYSNDSFADFGMPFMGDDQMF